MKPEISVVIPIKDAEDTLRRCILSVLKQTFTAFEVLCVDDTSSDRSTRIVRDAASADSRVYLIENTRNAGPGGARNEGIQAARGEYIFYLDADDTVPPQAFKKLLEQAKKTGSQLIKGAYIKEQATNRGAPPRNNLRRLLKQGETREKLTLLDLPSLLATTEGHWSYLYSVDYIRSLLYPEDITMGIDSVYLVSALANADSIDIISDVVYEYKWNPSSVMNSFTTRKRIDAFEWRRRAFWILEQAGYRKLARFIIFEYWNPQFFVELLEQSNDAEVLKVLESVEAVAKDVGCSQSPRVDKGPSEYLFSLAADGRLSDAKAMLREKYGNTRADKSENDLLALRSGTDSNGGRGNPSLRVATLNAKDVGGAGNGSLRRVQALRGQGVDAALICLVKETDKDYVYKVKPSKCDSKESNDDIWDRVRKKSVLPARKAPGFCAREFFSLSNSVLTADDVATAVVDADVVHLHWVVGMIDYANLPRRLAGKGVVWTLADMNAFSGGCHYSEGCNRYRSECSPCPLLGGDVEQAQNVQEEKAEFVRHLPQLQVICPSVWLAERAKESWVFRDTDVHVVPNPYWTDRETYLNKVVARIRLGLPIDKKLVLFGAHDLRNQRKGGNLLETILCELAKQGEVDNLNAVTYGTGAIETGLPTWNLGYIREEEQLLTLYAASDVYLFPSREDNAPLTIGESLMAGTPVVAFSVGHVPEIITHRQTGYIAEPGDVQAMASGVRWAVSLTECEKLRTSIACRLSAEHFHNPVESVRRHVEIYERSIRIAKADLHSGSD